MKLMVVDRRIIVVIRIDDMKLMVVDHRIIVVIKIET